MSLFNRNPEPAPEMTDGIVWRRNPDDLATRIEIGDVGGFLSSYVIIEAGTNAVMLVDGETKDVLAPGRYAMSTVWDKIKATLSFTSQPKKVTVVVIDTNDLDLTFGVTGIGQTSPDPTRLRASTKDPITLDFVLKLVVSINRDNNLRPNTMNFFMNVMKGRRRYSQSDLIAHLQPEVENALQEYVRRYSAAELNADYGKKAELEQAVETHLERTLGREGFAFKGVRAMRISHQRLDHISQQREELLLQVSEAQANLEKRRRLFDVLKEHDILDLADETRKVELHEKRAVLYARMRRSVLEDKTDELFTEAELDEVLAELDRQKLLREDDRAELRKQLTDSQRRRDHFLAKLDLDQRYELQMIEVQEQAGLDQQRALAQSQLARQMLASEMNLALLKAQGQIQLRNAQESAERERAAMLASDLRKRMIEDAQAAAEKRGVELGVELKTATTALEKARIQHEIAKLEREEDRLDGEMGIMLLDQMKAVRRKDDFEREERRLKSRQLELDMELTRKRAEHDMELAKMRTIQDHAIKHMETMGMLSPEAIIALSPVEQGRIISELKQTEAYKGMSEEQIMALMAAKSPAVAQALTARWQAEANKGAMSPEVKALYEKMSSDKDSAARAQTDQLERIMRMQQDAMLQMGGMIRDTAGNVSGNIGRNSPPAQTVIVGAAGGGPIVVPAGGANADPAQREVAVCPKCQHKSPVGTKFCSNCGHRFYD